MPIVLPKSRRPALTTSPDSLFIYGPPKCGKTGAALMLANTLIIDMEKGTQGSEACAVTADNISHYNEILAQIRLDTIELRKEPGKEKQWLYDFVVIDTVDKLEDYCVEYCTKVYNAQEKVRAAAKREQPEYVKSVYDLAYGKGYYYVREEFMGRINAAKAVCRKLILIGHVKDKALKEKSGYDIMDTEINLTGRLAGILTSYCDAIGYVYRDSDQKDADGNAQIMISFETMGDSINMGARHKHLRGKRMKLDWNLIYPGECVLVEDTELDVVK
jgi:hypothetical protein